MEIVVLVKHVPDATADRRFVEDDHTTDRDSVDGLLSELDEYAVEEAVSIVEDKGGQVTVLSMGPQAAGEAVRKALSMGADKGVHVLDDALHGSDTISTSLVLAKAVQKIGEGAPVDLVLTGMASTDGITAVVPAMLAERLGLPHLALLEEFAVEDSVLKGRRDSDASSESLESPIPAVVTVTDHVNEPRYPSFKGIMAAKKKPFETWSLADLGIAPDEVGLAAGWSVVESTSRRPPRQKGEAVPDKGEGGIQLTDYLAAQKFV